MGCDIIFDNNYNPYLIEMNMNPALDTSTKGQEAVVPTVNFKNKLKML